MAKTGVYHDVVDVKVTYTIGTNTTVVTLEQSTQASIKMEDKQDLWQPGGARFPTVSVTPTSRRGIDLRGGDCYKLALIPRNVLCVISGKIPDAENGVGEGCLLFTLNRAKIDDSSFGGKARDWATAGASFTSTSVDGYIDPLTLTEVGATT